MKKTKLGRSWLTALAFKNDAFGVEIKRKLEDRLCEKLSIRSIQSVLKRMEEKGFFVSGFAKAQCKIG